MKKIVILLLVSYPVVAISQNVGIGISTPTEKLEVKNPLRSTLKISSTNYFDTTQLILSNRDLSNQGTDFSIKSIREKGLFFSSLSDVPSNVSDNSLVILPNGNVGVNNPFPDERLSVSGNMNITGTIKANGVDGTANQVLMKNGSGFLSWGDMGEYKNYVVFNFTTSGAVQTFTVPAGVTKIKTQLWGGGGQGTGVGGTINMSAGGGGGGYVEGYMNVVPSSTVNVTVGRGASLSFSTSSSSQVSQGAISFTAFGGGNAIYDNPTTRITPGSGGNYSVTGTNNFIGVSGEAGEPSNLRYDQISATEYGRFTWGGDGGNAGNTTQTKGKSGQFYFNITASAILSQVIATNGLVPGGGLAVATAGGQSAGNGMVIIYY